ncbi:MAG TPA: DUF4337 domain-containing protein [Methylovirgula sp.]
MSETSPVEALEQAEHAEHAAHSGSSFLAIVSATIAILAVVAATVGSLEGIETGATINSKNDAVLLQNKSADTWAFFQAKSVKKNQYQIAAAQGTGPVDDFKKQATRYGSDEKDLQKQAEDLDHQTEAKLMESEKHERRHHVLTASVTLIHIAIAIATLSIILAGARWPWYTAIGLGILGVVGTVFAYL